MIDIYQGDLWYARNSMFRTGSPEGNVNIHPPRRFFDANSCEFQLSLPTGLKGKTTTRISQKVFKVLPLTPSQQAAVRMELLDAREVERITYIFQSPELWVINGLRLLYQRRRLELNHLFAKKEKEIEYAASRSKHSQSDPYLL